jgi:hypothetical protein
MERTVRRDGEQRGVFRLRQNGSCAAHIICNKKNKKGIQHWYHLLVRTTNKRPKLGIRCDDTIIVMSCHLRVMSPPPTSSRSTVFHIVCGWWHLCCATGQVNASTHAALPLAYSLLSSLVVVRWRAEASRGGRRHHVWGGGLVRPGAIRSAVCRRRRSTAGLVPQEGVRRRDTQPR